MIHILSLKKLENIISKNFYTKSKEMSATIKQPKKKGINPNLAGLFRGPF